MVAASPEAYARACFPFSILATHSSRHSRVGFPPREYSYLSCRRTPGDSCLKVVERPIKGTTDRESHFSGSCPAWIASVPKFLKGASPLKDDINDVKFKKCGERSLFNLGFSNAGCMMEKSRNGVMRERSVIRSLNFIS